jgi:hypothetical protein
VAAKTVRRNTTHMITTAADRTSKTLADRSAPVMDEIAGYAYALYLSRGGADGHDVEDWLQAERALRDSARITTD